jgi:uncharacterized membrane protein
MESMPKGPAAGPELSGGCVTARHRPDRIPGVTSSSTRTAAVLLAIGALTWLPTRWGVMTTWSGTWLGLDYNAWNQLSLLPLVLLALGAALATRHAPARSSRVGWAVTATGLALCAAGVALEFLVGGGLQDGPRDLAVAGWTLYLLGLAVVLVGSVVLAAALAARDRPAAGAAGFVAVAFLLWPVLLGTGQDALAVADQLVVALGWLVLAARLSAVSRRVPAAA